jgi:hypothetical protein
VAAASSGAKEEAAAATAATTTPAGSKPSTAANKTVARPKRRAENVRAEDEEGWVLEATDADCMVSRHDLDRRLKWVNDTAERIAPLVKAQFRRALVQDKELKRRRRNLENRIAEQVSVLKGGC